MTGTMFDVGPLEGIHFLRLELWAGALESGEFRQGRGRLCSDTARYCCLGVACEVAMRNGLPLTKTLPPGGNSYRYQGDANDPWSMSSAYLPQEVSFWYGFHLLEERDRRGNPYVGRDSGDGDLVRAAAANDDLGWGFRRVAAGIRDLYVLPPTAVAVAA